MRLSNLCDLFVLSVKKYASHYPQLSEYKDSLSDLVSNIEDPDYYVRYSNSPLLTINTEFEQANILGIYAFPFTEKHYQKLLNKTVDMSFQDMKYVIIFKPKDKSKIINKFKYSYDDFESDMNKFYDMYFDKLSDKGKEVFGLVVEKGFLNFDNPRFFLLFLEELKKHLPEEDRDKLIGKKIYNSSIIFRDLGYHGIYNGVEGVFFYASELEEMFIFEI